MAVPKPCPATYVLLPGEVDRLNELPAAAHDVKTQPACEFDEHDPDVRHCALLQAQEAPGSEQDDGALTNWWLRWSDVGGHTIEVEPTCKLPIAGNPPGAGCLLIAGHPGRCSPPDPPEGGNVEELDEDWSDAAQAVEVVREAFRMGASGHSLSGS